jgi:hypothetical protein
MSRRAQNRSKQCFLPSIHGTRSDCLIPGSYGIHRYHIYDTASVTLPLVAPRDIYL